jgi:hypothetical protein
VLGVREMRESGNRLSFRRPDPRDVLIPRGLDPLILEFLILPGAQPVQPE